MRCECFGFIFAAHGFFADQDLSFFAFCVEIRNCGLFEIKESSDLLGDLLGELSYVHFRYIERRVANNPDIMVFAF